MFILQQRWYMNLYSFNKASWCTGYDNKGQHFEKGRSATASYDNKTQHFVSELVSRCLPQRFSGGRNKTQLIKNNIQKDVYID